MADNRPIRDIKKELVAIKNALEKLERLINLYEEHPELLSNDPVNFFQ